MVNDPNATGMEEAPELREPAEDTRPDIEVQDLGQFIMMLTDWHKRQVATLEHLQLIPSGTDVSVEGEPPFTLEGPVLKAFQMGISLALSHLGNLPFNAEFVDPNATKH